MPKSHRRRRHVLKRQLHLHKILKEGTEKAAEIASNNMRETKDIIGFVHNHFFL